MLVAGVAQDKFHTGSLQIYISVGRQMQGNGISLGVPVVP